MARYLLPFLAATAVLAKTDLVGCTSLTSTITGSFGSSKETLIFYDPDTLEICSSINCGGGTASSKKIPGCPAYSGTETVTKSFLPSCATVKHHTVTVTQTLTPPRSNNWVGSTTVTVTPTRTSTIVKTVTTSSGVSELTSGTSEATARPSGTDNTSLTSTEAEAAPTGNGAEVSSSTVPAGAGPTARAGMAGILGVAAAVVAFA
ncbi:hypothetical protein CORC01_00778 [Colletotrichum orchidophilum]|uniref:Uncharacterized protein n=1 Tax=Colletotrichum orchidophilum TaxID=1209926 RepID=A0A1G4BRI8_9PEZI|nr:uncharacterized protein CORC01_00778 [Colletotrichum orchidophilum]OHF03916.1 hypothetical protein CORC01_00778 [Colletotrichum orchidophilum]